jgi:Protein of unknown function (DUF1116)
MHARGAIDYAQPFGGAHWFDVLPRSAACPDLAATVLLHAGPPYRGAPPAPVINAAVQALLFEQLAPDPVAARALLLSGGVQLRPAQGHGIVTPLAQVVSSSMLLVAVKQQDQIGYAPLVEGPAPALRFGSVAAGCLQRLRDVSAHIDTEVAPRVRRDPVAIAEIIGVAVAAGDECHARTSAANEALVATLHRLGADCAGLLTNPAFVLPILMAAAAAAMRTCRSEIEAIGGNGIDFGVRGRGGKIWQQLPAEAPRGTRLAGHEAVTALAAIGDSAVIDFCGLGGQMGTRDLIDPHSGIIDPERVARSARAPLINLAILDREGAVGLIGRGFYRPPMSLFA